MSVELSISSALPFKRRPKVSIRIISLALHRVITIAILSTHTLNLDYYPWTNLLDNTHVSPWIQYLTILRVKTTSMPMRLRILSLCATTSVNRDDADNPNTPPDSLPHSLPIFYTTTETGLHLCFSCVF